jgi:hypothetical protein
MDHDEVDAKDVGYLVERGASAGSYERMATTN